jgi:hypothetical protein
MRDDAPSACIERPSVDACIAQVLSVRCAVCLLCYCVHTHCRVSCLRLRRMRDHERAHDDEPPTAQQGQAAHTGGMAGSHRGAEAAHRRARLSRSSVSVLCVCVCPFVLFPVCSAGRGCAGIGPCPFDWGLVTRRLHWTRRPTANKLQTHPIPHPQRPHALRVKDGACLHVGWRACRPCGFPRPAPVDSDAAGTTG